MGFANPQPTDCHIAGHGNQPGHRAVTIYRVAVCISPDIDERILQSIFRFGAIHQNAETDAELLTRCRVIEGAEGTMIPKSRANLAGLQSVNVILKFTGSGNTIKIPQVKHLNNIIEQDHRFVKRITGPMLGFKAFHSAEATLAGIETTHMIRKGQLHASGLTAFQQFAALAA
jgi:putative transposase